MAMAAIGAMALPKMTPKSFSIWGAQIKHVGVAPVWIPAAPHGAQFHVLLKGMGDRCLGVTAWF